MWNVFAVFNQLSPTCYLHVLPPSDCLPTKFFENKCKEQRDQNKQTTTTNKQKQFFQLLLLRKKKKSRKKLGLLGFEHRPLRYQCRALTIELASQLGAGHFLKIFFPAFSLLPLSYVFNCDHFLCIYLWFKYMKFINSPLQISSGKLFVAFTKCNKAMFVKLSTSFSIPFHANLLRFPFYLV